MSNESRHYTDPAAVALGYGDKMRTILVYAGIYAIITFTALAGIYSLYRCFSDIV